MELYEKIIIASAMGLYLCFLIYQNRDYFTRSRKGDHSKNGSWVLDDGETIIKEVIQTPIKQMTHKKTMTSMKQ